MDAQIWYSVYCSVFGGVYGILHHLGEVSQTSLVLLYFEIEGFILNSFSFQQIRTQGMLRSKFDTLPSAFNSSLIPPQRKDNKEGIKMWICQPDFLKVIFPTLNL